MYLMKNGKLKEKQIVCNSNRLDLLKMKINTNSENKTKLKKNQLKTHWRYQNLARVLAHTPQKKILVPQKQNLRR